MGFSSYASSSLGYNKGMLKHKARIRQKFNYQRVAGTNNAIFKGKEKQPTKELKDSFYHHPIFLATILTLMVALVLWWSQLL